MNRSLSSLKWHACNAVDAAAGDARQRYITDVPGQQAVYMVKLEQAQAYLANSSASAPYVHAEAQAMSEEPAAVAANIVALASHWNEQLGPLIEAARLAGKRAVNEADDAAAVAEAEAAAIAVLCAL